MPEKDDNEPPELTPRLEHSDNDDSDSEDDKVSESDKEEAEAEMNQKYGPRQHSRSLRD